MEKSENSFFSPNELVSLGFKRIGHNVVVSRYARFYNIQSISIGDHVRIDDFCILSGNITLGSYIHISAYCALYGSRGIEMSDFSGLSARTIIYSAMDDFSGEHLIGPMINSNYTNVKGGLVEIGKYVQIGANSIIFPNVILPEGVVIGAHSMVNSSLDSWGIYAGIPCKFIRKRKRNLEELARKFLNNS